MKLKIQLTFLLLFFVSAILYVGGGAIYAVRQGVKPMQSVSAHPHMQHWLFIGALVRDGVAFSRAKIDNIRSRTGSATYVPIQEAQTAKQGPAGNCKPSDVADDDDSQDEVVE